MNQKRKVFAIYAITKHGLEAAKKIKQSIPEADLFVSRRVINQAPAGSIELSLPLGPQLAGVWKNYDCHIFVVSVGAVMRLTKDLLENKKVDPAVVCVDDAARFSICLLSGHVGRGNLYTQQVADLLGAIPVITTASDSLGTLSADILGRELGWTLDDPDRNVTTACAEVVNGNRTLFVQETGEPNFWPLNAVWPPGVEYTTSLEGVDPQDYAMLLIASDRNIAVTHPDHWRQSVIYRPKSLVLGMGCDRDTPLDVLEKGMLRFLETEGLSLKSVKAIVSIDKKADEVALIALAEKYEWPFVVYPAQELDEVSGIEYPSEVVKKYVGTCSVAEAACLLHAGAERLLMPKKSYTQSKEGKNMTMAIARIPFPQREPVQK